MRASLWGAVVGVVALITAFLLWGWASAAEEEPYTRVKERYIAAVDAVCERASRQSDENEPAGLAAQVNELHRVSESMTTTVSEIEAIAPPGEDAARVRDGFHTPARALAAGLRELSGRAEAALRDGREKEARLAVERSLEPDENEKALRAFAAAYGFRTCAGE
ncbi:hypothetical protein SAMN05444920_13115 [Nonomuraea solani]|uniref:Uncharacterized protein n=1 Tax=Nonomuraea solani TaxID=1144553 RepID=A0A1H6EZX0_9ACTN|nr:hypothetical protein [Nonomuraea solani]SEH02903.1 hypothetical protein SAMN05444920_13115 [Nonomuraea solani]